MTGVVTRTHRNLRDALRRSSIASFQTLVHHFKDLTHLENENLNSESVSIDEKGLQSDKEPTPPTSEIQESASWKFLQGSETGLHDSLIPESAWKVLRLLHRKGFEAYLVGGSVRDLLLKRTPKDFDILTTAEPSEVKKHFARIMRCMIIGRRFPICHVYSLGTVVEVSSFSTNGSLKNQRRCDSTGVTPDSNISNSAKLCTDRDFARWKNCMKRDFTVNGLLYDPFGHVLYDYIGGLKDLKERKLRTIVSADDSFEEDSARMLRAIRIAARLGFQFSRDTASSIHTYALLLSSINKARLMAEVDIMMAYGSAEPSLRLLWRFGVLDLLLPLQASYFTSQRFRRRGRGVNLLLILLRNLDRVVAPSRACHSSLWVALLAFHLALEKKKRSHIVAAAGALAVCYQDMQEALAKTRRVESRLKQGEFAVDDTYFLDVKDLSEDDIQEQASELLDDAVESLRNMLDEDFLEKATEYNEGQYKSKMGRGPVLIKLS
ncbi:hypothetical protein O6H91_08G111900 [Diphasiastrum complanatum]|uniref:Uncharacterized protein n=1 Tax=Diphasiastrum complanatum TaxID=34168 RepID=A0ACC2D1E6_DIPCM|nr:hypothetical protein O6H91_08G111900 [Diphasiastrum complanatum]